MIIFGMIIFAHAALPIPEPLPGVLRNYNAFLALC